jgi:ketosteroid isomerase-like protein
MSQLTPAQMDALLDAHYKFEAADDVDGVVSTLTDDVVHDVVGFPGGPLHGKAAARAIGHPFGFDGRNRPFSHRLLHILEFRDGLIARENVWADYAASAEQLGTGQ